MARYQDEYDTFLAARKVHEAALAEFDVAYAIASGGMGEDEDMMANDAYATAHARMTAATLAWFDAQNNFRFAYTTTK